MTETFETTPKVLYLSDVIKLQAIINIGMIGHVSHGKSTLTRSLTSKKTQQHSSERNTNGRTIKLGYANGKIFRDPITLECFAAPSKTTEMTNPKSGEPLEIVMHYSIPDCPGHHEFMATMMAGTTVMDTAILVVAANEETPQPQTHEHLLALKQAGIKPCLVIHNKLDLLKAEQVVPHKQLLDKYLATTVASEAPVLPISAELGYNLDKVIDFLAHRLHSGVAREYNAPLQMTIVRSFNINRATSLREAKEGAEVIRGAVVGGTIQKGILSKGDIVELRPGLRRPHPSTGRPVWQPLYGKVLRLESDVGVELEQALPGGLVAVQLSVDAGLATDDSLAGFQLTHLGETNLCYQEIEGEFERFDTSSLKYPKKTPDNLRPGTKVTLVSSGSMTTSATITWRHKHKQLLNITSTKPLPLDLDTSKIAVLFENKLVAVLHNLKYKGTKKLDFFLPSEYQHLNENQPARQVFKVIDDLAVEHIERHPRYEQLLDHIRFRDEDVTQLKLPNVKLPGGRPSRHETIIVNVADILAALTYLDPAPPNAIDLWTQFELFFKQELTDKAHYNGATPRQLLLKGRHKQTQLDSLVKKFVSTLFFCTSCRNSLHTVITKEPGSKLYSRRCLDCTVTTTCKTLF